MSPEVDTHPPFGDVRLKRLLILALALVAALGVVSSASAKGRDRNNDRLPDRWERAHHLSLKASRASATRTATA